MARQKEIKRVVYVSDISEIDFDNFGVHFTENIEYNHTGGGSGNSGGGHGGSVNFGGGHGGYFKGNYG